MPTEAVLFFVLFCFYVCTTGYLSVRLSASSRREMSTLADYAIARGERAMARQAAQQAAFHLGRANDQNAEMQGFLREMGYALVFRGGRYQIVADGPPMHYLMPHSRAEPKTIELRLDIPEHKLAESFSVDALIRERLVDLLRDHAAKALAEEGAFGIEGGANPIRRNYTLTTRLVVYPLPEGFDQMDPLHRAGAASYATETGGRI